MRRLGSRTHACCAHCTANLSPRLVRLFGDGGCTKLPSRIFTSCLDGHSANAEGSAACCFATPPMLCRLPYSRQLDTRFQSPGRPVRLHPFFLRQEGPKELTNNISYLPWTCPFRCAAQGNRTSDYIAAGSNQYPAVCNRLPRMEFYLPDRTLRKTS